MSLETGGRRRRWMLIGQTHNHICSLNDSSSSLLPSRGLVSLHCHQRQSGRKRQQFCLAPKQPQKRLYVLFQWNPFSCTVASSFELLNWICLCWPPDCLFVRHVYWLCCRRTLKSRVVASIQSVAQFSLLWRLAWLMSKISAVRCCFSWLTRHKPRLRVFTPLWLEKPCSWSMASRVRLCLPH